jgi:hypothetical protein
MKLPLVRGALPHWLVARDESTAPRPSVTSSTTALENSSTSASVDTQVPDPITRPITDPTVCEARSAREATLTDETLTLFAISREAPIPIQIIGRADGGSYDAFALVRSFELT